MIWEHQDALLGAEVELGTAVVKASTGNCKQTTQLIPRKLVLPQQQLECANLMGVYSCC